MEERLSKDGKHIIVGIGTFRYKRPKVGGHMHKHLPVGEIGDFKVTHKVATPEDVKSYKISSIFSYSYGEYYDFEPGTYTKLIIKGSIVMSDTPMEIRTNRQFMDTAKGSVLIGGLGLGVVLLAIQDRPEVTSVLVVEKYKEVIELVAKHLPLNKKVTIVQGDIFEWLPDKKAKFDTIYFDIWTDMRSDNYLQMKELHKRFRKFLNKENPQKWMSSWKYDWAKSEHYAANRDDRERESFRCLFNPLSAKVEKGGGENVT